MGNGKSKKAVKCGGIQRVLQKDDTSKDVDMGKRAPGFRPFVPDAGEPVGRVWRAALERPPGSLQPKREIDQPFSLSHMQMLSSVGDDMTGIVGPPL
jgi:hypothetical protein